MKSITQNILILSALSFFAACNNDSYDPDSSSKDPVEITLTRNEQEMVKAGNDFSFNLYRQIAAGNQKNMLISPLSASQALGMVINGVDSQTLEEMKTALGFKSYTVEDVNKFYEKLIHGLLTTDPSTELTLAHSIWIDQKSTVFDSFIRINQATFDAEITRLDFMDPSSVDKINQWCEDKTNNRIKKMIAQLAPDDYMILINALFFKGEWVTKFEKEETFKTNFTNGNSSTSKVDMMAYTNQTAYFDNLDVQIAELPYGNKAFSMVILLPKENASIQQIEELLTAEQWDEWMQQLQNNSLLDVRLPKFKLEYERELNDDLKALGIQEAFSSWGNFSKMSPDNLYIGKVKQKTFIEVDEEGTEAAAVTTVGIAITSLPDTPQAIDFYVNRPFIYVIKEKSTNSILFIGKIEEL